MRTVFATAAVLAAVATALPALAAPGATPPATLPAPTPLGPLAPPPPQPLTLEAKAGCGVALVAIEQIALKFPGAMGKGAEQDRRMTALMMQVMGRQGQVFLEEAFAEGARRNMTPAQVYTAGIGDVMSNFPTEPDDETSSQEFLARFMARCLIPGGMPS